jgi:GNAT superfamily N-acetyltransferase
VLARVDGEPAGTGSLVIDGGVGWLSGDSTLPRYRRRGVQQAIQRHRLQLARDAGCDLAVIEATPGGASQRNTERLGFRIVYTHVKFVKG